MCIKCLLLEMLAKREALFTPIGEEALARGEAIHEELATPGNPGTAGTAQPAQPEYDQYDLLEMERTHAEIRNTNADAILKLANAAGALYKANLDTSGVLRTLEQLYYPAPPTVEPKPVSKAEAEATETPASDELPPELAEYIAHMKAAGFEVDVVRIPL